MDFDVKKETLRFLDKAGIEYELFEHEPAFTLEQCAWVEKLTGATVYKNLLLCPSNESEFILLVMGGYRIFSYLCDRGAVDTATYLPGATALVLAILGLMLASRSFRRLKELHL